MMNEIVVNFNGVVTVPPAKNYTPAGVAFTEFIVVNQPVYFDSARGYERVEGEPNVMTCLAWHNLAETLANEFSEGQEVRVSGHLKTRKFVNEHGEDDMQHYVDVVDAGPSLMNGAPERSEKKAETVDNSEWDAVSEAANDKPTVTMAELEANYARTEDWYKAAESFEGYVERQRAKYNVVDG